MVANLSKPFSANREDLAWAAGLFEGEGTFSTRSGRNGGKRDRGLTAKIKMADEDVVRKFYSIVTVGNLTGPYPSDGIGTKSLWVWQTGSFEGVQAVIAMLWPWLHSRRKARAKELLIRYYSVEGIRGRKSKKAV